LRVVKRGLAAVVLCAALSPSRAARAQVIYRQPAPLVCGRRSSGPQDAVVVQLASGARIRVPAAGAAPPPPGTNPFVVVEGARQQLALADRALAGAPFCPELPDLLWAWVAALDAGSAAAVPAGPSIRAALAARAARLRPSGRAAPGAQAAPPPALPSTVELLESEAQCLDDRKERDAALVKKDAMLAALASTHPRGDPARAQMEIEVADWLSERLSRHADAERRLRAVIADLDRAHPETNANTTATSMRIHAYGVLASVQSRAGHHDEARQAFAAYQRYEAARGPVDEGNQIAGPNALYVGQALEDITHRMDLGDLDGVRRDLERAPTTDIFSLSLLGRLEMAAGDRRAAVAAFEDGAEGVESDLSRILRTGGDTGGAHAMVAGWVTVLSAFEAPVIQIATTPEADDHARALAFWLAEQRKGRFFDSQALVTKIDPRAATSLQALRFARGRRAARFLRSVDLDHPVVRVSCEEAARRKVLNTDRSGDATAAADRADLRDPEVAEIDRLERALAPRLAAQAALPRFESGASRRSDYPRGSAQAFLDAVRVRLGPRSRFVGYARFDVNDLSDARRVWPPRPAVSHYAAFVVAPDGLRAAVDLGPASVIDELVARALIPLEKKPAPDERVGAATMRVWQQLYDRVWRPLATPLEGAWHVTIASDGALLAIPFAALHDGHRWLSEQVTLSELDSARELVAATSALREASGPPLVLVDPVAPPAPNSSRIVDPSRFPPLSFAEDEGAAVHGLIGGTLLHQSDANERVLLEARAPQILHVASHGVTLPEDGLVDAREGERGIGATLARAAALWLTPGHDVNERWMRAALVLSRPPPDAAGRAVWDGFATGYEVMTMDLRGTELVTLSACGTGRGAVLAEYGISSLERAFVNAGAESVVATAWQVDDRSTALWMTTFYSALMRRRSRAQAMQEAMAAVRARYPHPYYWAPFTLSGEPGPLRHLPSLPGAAAR
jgi:CHAT domain-containing protein